MYYTFNTFTTGECKPKPDSDIRITVMSLTSESSSNMTNKMNKKINEEGDVERGSVIDNLFKLIPEFKDVNDFANDDPLYTQENSDESNGELKPEEQKKLIKNKKEF